MLVSWRRLRQFARALTARVHPEEHALAASLLPPAAVRLYAQMPRPVQRHSLDVLYGLQERGEVAPELLAAALLHDVAKAAGVRVWHRVLSVLLRALHPGWLERLASSQPGTWRYPFWLQLHHARLGAEQAEAAGCAPATVQLIRYHQQSSGVALDPSVDRWLDALQAVDAQV